MESVWIDDSEQLEQFFRSVDGGPVTVDTESDHFHAYQARVCLFQVAVGEREALIDPLALDASPLSPLFDVLEDPDTVSILHSARNDIMEIDRDYGVGINNLFDTQVAARFLGTKRNSLTWMLEELLGVIVGKEFKRFDWTTRPVPDKARRYAVNDVRYLDDLRERFTGALAEQGWLEPFCQQCDFLTHSVVYEANEFDPAGWRKLDGSDTLEGQGRATLKELYQWRHELCSDKNQSAVTLLPNGPLLRLARDRPTTAPAVAEITGVSERLAEEHGGEIVNVIEESTHTDFPPKDPPSTSYDPPPPDQKNRYHALRKWRNEKAGELDIPSEFIATNDTISDIAADPPETVEQFERFDPVLPWHIARLGKEMLEVLKTA